MSASPEALGAPADGESKLSDTPDRSDKQTPSQSQALLGAQNNFTCDGALDKIEAFYAHLDQAPYMQSFGLNEPSDIYFTALLKKLSDHPPIVAGETNDLFSVLKNTAHFYRVIGQKNINILKAILDQEKSSFEEVLADFYSLTNHPSCLKRGFSLQVKQNSLYEYAGFFLNTIGGRLYLFRRDSVSRMVVSYYSIRIIDQANRDNNNKDGIDIRPAIAQLINELENSDNQLKMKKRYLDTLYKLQEKYM